MRELEKTLRGYLGPVVFTAVTAWMWALVAVLTGRWFRDECALREGMYERLG